MKIGISGASGNLGQSAVAELTARGAHEIVAISRTPDAVAGVEARRGDYDQPETLASAYSGLDRLALIPSADMTPGVRGRQLRAAIDAAVEAGVKHILLVSAAGTREAAVPALVETYWTAEQHLIRTAPRWTIVRMNYYSESMAEEMAGSLERGVLAGLGSERVAYVSRDDVAAAVAGALVSEGHAGAIYNATGPAVITGEDRAALASELFGKPLAFMAIPVDQLRAGMAQMGLPEMIVQVVVDIKTTFVDGYFDVLTTDVERLSGRQARSFKDVLATFAK